MANVNVSSCQSCGGASLSGIQFHAMDCATLNRVSELREAGMSQADVAQFDRETREKDAHRALGFYSDEQLRAECRRRDVFAGTVLTNDELRAECERRKISFDTLAQIANDPHLTLREEARHWKEFCGIAERQVVSTAAERDEWKRRAEVAEQRANVAAASARSARSSRSELHEEFLRLVEVLTPEQAKDALEALQNIDNPAALIVDASQVSAEALEQINEQLPPPLVYVAPMDDHERHKKTHAEAFGDVYREAATALRKAQATPSVSERLRWDGPGDSASEDGPGIASRDIPKPERSGTVDLATLADLLADDAP